MDDPNPLFVVESPGKIGDEYTAPEPIRVLKGLEAVRERPGMYIGDIGVNGLHHLLKEIVDNSIDEAMAGHCTQITVVYGTDYRLSVEDNGRGIPVEIIGDTGKTGVELVLTELHAGGQYSIKSHLGDYRVYGGLHGVGASCVNALSTWLECEVKRDGTVYRMRFERGIPTGPLSVVGDCDENEHGTKITWLADASIFTQALAENGHLNYNPDRIRDRLRELAFLNREVAISFADARNGKATETFHSSFGAVDFVAYLNEGKKTLHYPIFAIGTGSEERNQIEVALQYHEGNEETIVAFANNIALTDGGTPVTGFKTALTRVINRTARKNNFLYASDANFKGEIVRRGLTAIISVRLTNPQFWGSTKTHLNNPEIEGAVNRVVGRSLAETFARNTALATTIVAKIAAAAKAR